MAPDDELPDDADQGDASPDSSPLDGDPDEPAVDEHPHIDDHEDDLFFDDLFSEDDEEPEPSFDASPGEAEVAVEDEPDVAFDEFDEGEGGAAGASTDAIDVLDEDEAERASIAGHASPSLGASLDEMTEREAFAEDVALAEREALEPDEAPANDAGEESAYVDADPTALDAAAGLGREPVGLVGTAPAEPQVDVARRHLRGLLEALLFVAERPMKAADLAEIARAETKDVRSILEELSEHYRTESRGFQLDELAGGFQLRTSAAFAPFVRELTQAKPVRLSRAQVETLAIIAYRQPITRPEIEDIRGVDAGAVLKLLLDRDMVRVLGKKDEPGRPLLYGTTSHFLTFFGLKSLKDLPTLREFTELTEESREVVERELGEVLPEGPHEPPPAVVGDASVAPADVDPELAAAEAPIAPEADAAGERDADVAPTEAEATETGTAAPDPGHDRDAAPTEAEDVVAEPSEPPAEDEDAAEDERDIEGDDADDDDVSPPGGSTYDPSDEELFPDDDDEEDEDEEDEDEDEDDDDDEDDED